MREIKFRIWDKKYHTFDFNASPDLFISQEGEIYEKDERTWAMQTYIEYNKSDSYELSQYTGLKDKNGKEIYEGDLLKTEDGTIVKVVYDEASFKCVFRHNGKLKNTILDNLFISMLTPKVIGNIYENQELFK